MPRFFEPNLDRTDAENLGTGFVMVCALASAALFALMPAEQRSKPDIWVPYTVISMIGVPILLLVKFILQTVVMNPQEREQYFDELKPMVEDAMQYLNNILLEDAVQSLEGVDYPQHFGGRGRF